MNPSRRRILRSAPLAAVPLAAGRAAEGRRSEPEGSITDVPGVRVGHWTSDRRPTGCTVVLTEAGAVAGVDVRGGGPGTRETDLLRPEATVERAHAVCLSGGSAYGLATADGVMRFLEDRGVGFRVAGSIVPIVPAAILFDLEIGNDPSIRPDAEAGFAASEAATDGPVEQGNVGAGAGATLGKLLGKSRAMKGGLGSASIRLPDGVVVGALVAVNALGDVVDPGTGEILAGARDREGTGFADASARIREGLGFTPSTAVENTTLGVVAANVGWTQAQAVKVAQMAHDGLARAVRPIHLPFDGDTIFTLGTGEDDEPLSSGRLGLLGAVAADVVALAVVSAILHARGVAGRPAHRDLVDPE